MSRKQKTDGQEKKRPPPVKVLSGQLRAAGIRCNLDSGSGCVIRLSGGRSLLVSLVWMQGTVLEFQLDRNTALLLDETGTFTVQGINSVPKGKPCLSQGKCCMSKFSTKSVVSVSITVTKTTLICRIFGVFKQFCVFENKKLLRTWTWMLFVFKIN